MPRLLGWSHDRAKSLRRMLWREQITPAKEGFPQDHELIARIRKAIEYLDERRFGRRV